MNVKHATVVKNNFEKKRTCKMQKLGDIKVTITSNVITLLTCNPILTPPKYQKRFCILNYIKSHSHDKEMCLHYLSIIQTGISYLASQTVMSASRWKLHSSSLQSSVSASRWKLLLKVLIVN